MEDKNNAIEANAPAIAPGEEVKVLPAEDDLEGKVKTLEAEKNRLIEESANYKMAYLKEKKRNGEDFGDDAEEKMRQIAAETLSNSRLSEIARELDAINQKALKENKELKLAQLNKTNVPQSMGSHSESQPVKDTLVTSEQMEAFKARGWSDKDIERYKRNLQKNAR